MFGMKLASVCRCTTHLALLLLTSSVADAGPWAEVPANLTVGEYLSILFETRMARREEDGLNSWSMVRFYASSDPQTALVVVTQAWHDERLKPEDLRREIRSGAKNEVEFFGILVRRPTVSNRWRIANPQSNIVIHHVRESDHKETLGVTWNGETLFDEEGISKAKADVISRDAFW